MTVYDRAYSGCKGSKNEHGECSATVKITDDDLLGVNDIEGESEQLQALVNQAAAGCAKGCQCKAGAAKLVTQTTISVTSSDPTSGKPDFPKKNDIFM